MIWFRSLAAVVALSATTAAQPLLAPGSPIRVGGFVLSVSDPVPVGTRGELVSVVLSVTNFGTSDNITAFSGVIGAEGSLHHEQFPGVPPIFGQVSTPTSLSAANSSVDSHFLPFGAGAAAVNPPFEQTGDGSDGDGLAGVLSGEPGDFNVGGFVGFGPVLSGDFGFAPANFGTTVELAQLVVLASSVSPTNFDFQIGTESPGVSTRFVGCIGGLGAVCVPEPSTSLLCGLGLASFVASRRVEKLSS